MGPLGVRPDVCQSAGGEACGHISCTLPVLAQPDGWGDIIQLIRTSFVLRRPQPAFFQEVWPTELNKALG